MILRTCLCIPTYNNRDTIQRVVVDCLSHTSFPVLVFDDGSDIPVESLLVGEPCVSARASGRLHLLRFSENQGKGEAIQSAIDYAVREGFTHLFTIDGDGQHLVSEIPKLMEAAKSWPWDLIVGNRKLQSETVPDSTKFGRRFSNFWVGIQTGSKIGDSQSGFRVYPLFRLQNMRFWTRRYDFEIEVLIRLLWKGVSVRDVEIDVYYPPKEKRVSHFHKFWDNLRISLLNTVLVTLALLKSHKRPFDKALALGAGVFIGCTPFFGFHTAIVAGASVIFRLNLVLLWIGSHISMPPLAPFLAIASIRIGRTVLGQPPIPIHGLSGATTQFSYWLLGSLVLGVTLGGVVMIFSLWVGKILRRKPKGNWTGRMRGGSVGNWILLSVAKTLGLRAAYFCLYFVIPYFYIFAPKARRAALEYWRIREPRAGFFRRQRLVFRQLILFGRLLLDRVVQGHSEKPCFRSNPHGMENIVSAAQQGRGLLLVGAHIGGWDLSASLLREDGFSGELYVLQHEATGLTLNKVAGNRGRDHVKAIASGKSRQSILEVRQLLGLGKVVAVMADRPVAGQFELVSFQGKLAPFDATPFRLAATCRAPAAFTFGFKNGEDYDFFATVPKNYEYLPGENKSLRSLEWIQEFVFTVERFLDLYPEQWTNFFPFWSSVPENPVDEKATKGRNNLIEELRKPIPRAPELELGVETNVAPEFLP